MSDLRTFQLDIGRFASKAVPEALGAVVRKISLEALDRIVRKTPVRTGRARGNWQVGIGRTPSGETGVLDPSGSRATASGRAALMADLPPFPVVHIANNVPYIIRLEDGYSRRQAPSGMVKVTVEELRAKYG